MRGKKLDGEIRRRAHDGIAAIEGDAGSCGSPTSTSAASACSSAPISTCRRTTAGSITDDTRIRASVPAIRDALTRGAAVMVTSHLGRPTEGEWTTADSLAPVAPRLGELLGPRRAADARLGRRRRVARALTPGDVVLLENCRINRGREEGRSTALAQKMAKLCDVYCNDAFGTAHRAEATTHGIATLAPIACAGPADGGRARRARPRRSRTRSGRWWRSSRGSKVSTKLTILRALAAKVDALIVGGGIANTFMLARGRHDRQVARRARSGRRSARRSLDAFPGKVPIPVDAVVRAGSFAGDAPSDAARRSRTSRDDDMILDIGPQYGRGARR